MYEGEEHSPNGEIQRTAISILNYLRLHPGAVDNSAGIAQWWVHEEPGTVKKALEILVAEGIVEQKGGLYRLKHTASTKRASSSPDPD